MLSFLRFLDEDGAVFSRLPVIDCGDFILRPVRKSDAADVFEWCGDEDVARYVQWSAYESLADAKRFVRFILRQYRFGEPSSFAIEDKVSERMIGTCGFMNWNRDFRSAEVGYSLSKKFWNKGIMTRALVAVLDFGFDKMRLNRIEAQHIVGNDASGRVMEKCQMKREGTLRQRIYCKGNFRDMVLYAILKEDRIKKMTKTVEDSKGETID